MVSSDRIPGKVIPLNAGKSRRAVSKKSPIDARHPAAQHRAACEENSKKPARVTPIRAAGQQITDDGSATHSEQQVPTDCLDSGKLFSVRKSLQRNISETAEYVIQRMTGDYHIDDYGFDQHFTENIWLPALRVLFEKWFRVTVTGVENLPIGMGGLLVANHAGSIPIDALMTTVAVHDYHPEGEFLRVLAADMAFDSTFGGELARKTGATLACSSDAERLLRDGHLTAVWPEGYKGIGKLYKDRYKLQRFGRGGFVTTAIRTGAPIIPVSIVGSEEIYPMLSDLKPLARILGLPYIPVTPTFPLLGPLGLVPLPSKWHIHFGEPIETSHYDESAADDPMVIFNVTDHVREEIQQTLFTLLRKRTHIYFG